MHSLNVSNCDFFSGKSHSKERLSKIMREPHLIEDEDLAVNIYMCTLNDTYYGPLLDALRHSGGKSRLKIIISYCGTYFDF